MSEQDAHATLYFGTWDKVHHLQNLNEKGPKGEVLSLGYVTTTHSFMLPYKMTSDYVLVVKGGQRDLGGRLVNIFHRLPKEKIEQMQRTGVLPNPLPPYRHTIFHYLGAYLLWWSIPAVFALVAFFQMLGISSRRRAATRSA